LKDKTKGISLIVLIITIIVIIILAGAVILSLSQNNPINSGNEAVFKSDLKTFESDLTMYLTEKYVSTVGSYNPENLKADDLTAEYGGVIIPGVTIKDIIPVLSTTNKYNGQLEIVNGRLVYKGTDIPKKRWAEEINLEVVNGDRLNAIISTVINLPISAGTDAVCTIKISSNSSINSINLGGNLELLDVNSVPVTVQPVFTIGTPTGNNTDTLRNVDITINTTTLVEGTYKLKLKARCISNIYGITNETDVETGVLFEIDNTPPTNPGVSVSPTGWTNGNVTVTIDYPLGDILKEYSMDAATWSSYTASIIVTTNNTTIYARAIDTAGNQSGQTTITIANIDKQLPTVSFATNGGTNLQIASTTVTVNDTGASGIDINSLQYIWDTQNIVLPTDVWTTFVSGEAITKSDVNGTYYLWIKAIDNAGNSIITKSNGFVADNEVPENPIISTYPTGWTNGNVTVTITYPIDAVIKEYSTNGTTWSAYTSEVIIATNNTTVYAKGTDASGNQSGQSTTTVANIDKITPTVVYGTNGGINLQTASTTVTTSDLGGSILNISTLQYVWDIQNITTPSGGWAVFTNASTITKASINGTYYLWIKATDNAGNSIVTKSNSFVADNTAPTNPTISANPTGWTNANVTVTITYPGDAAIKEYSTNGTTWNAYISPVVVTVNSTTVYGRATDASGNQSGQCTLTVANIDKTAPSAPNVNFNGYTPGTWTSSNITLNLTSTDANSGISKYQWSTNGSTWNDFVSSWIYNYDTAQTTTFRSVDNAGNASSATSYYNILRDATAPTYSSFSVTNVTADTYDVNVFGVTDAGSGVNRLQFPTWTAFNGQDDIVWDWSTNSIVTGQNLGGGTWKYTAKRSEHNNEYGEYVTHLYLYDNLGNAVGSSLCTATLIDPTIAVRFNLTAAQEIFNGSTSYYAGGEVANNYTIEFDAQPSDTISVLSENNTNSDQITSKHRFIVLESHGGGAPNAGLGVSLGTNGLTVIAHSAGYYHVLLAYYTNLNAWNHYRIVVQNRVPRLYVNGILVRNGYAPLSSYTKIYSIFAIGTGCYGNFIGRANNFVFYNVAK